MQSKEDAGKCIFVGIKDTIDREYAGGNEVIQNKHRYIIEDVANKEEVCNAFRDSVMKYDN